MKPKITTLILALSLSINAQNILMKDGGALTHNLGGQAIGMISGWVAYKRTNKIWVGMLASVLSSAIVGIAKEEIWDRAWHRGTPTYQDKLNTCWGGMVGAICLVPFMVRHQDKIYEAEQLCNDIKNPIFLKDSIK